LNINYKIGFGKWFVWMSSVLGPLDVPEAEWGLVLLAHMELHTFAAVAVPGAFVVLAGTVLFDVVAHG